MMMTFSPLFRSAILLSEELLMLASLFHFLLLRMRFSVRATKIDKYTTYVVGYPNPNKMEQSWECIFLNIFTHINLNFSKLFHVNPKLEFTKLFWTCKMTNTRRFYNCTFAVLNRERV